ncbi:MAG TPA: hypothetical protein VF980_08200 [Thermoanaerobaculia bacterium]
MDLESQLKSALARKQPPPGFASRVVAAVNRGPRTEERGRFRWRAIAAAAMLTVILGGWTAHEIAERREGERARNEVLLALRIAGAKVRYAQTQVHDIGSKR